MTRRLYMAGLWVVMGTISCAQCGPTQPVNTDGGGASTSRCEVDLQAYLDAQGQGASVQVIENEGQLIGGPNAQGKVGDWLIENDKIRVVVQGARRSIGPSPFGGTLLDADLVRSGPGRDLLGEIGLLYNFGRTFQPEVFEVLRSGSEGGPAVLAATGNDVDHDYLAIRNQLVDIFGAPPVADPLVKLPLRVTQYFILAPGEARLQYLTAFCNEGDADVTLAVGDIADPGHVLEFFNPQSCTGGFGFGGVCFGLDRASWYGYHGEGVAYGYAPYRVNAPTLPEASNALLTVAGITGSVIGGNGLTGMAEWFNANSTGRPGAFRVGAGKARYIARDFFVAEDIGEIASLIETQRSQKSSTILGNVSGQVLSNGQPVPQARVTFKTETALAATFVTDDTGSYRGTLPLRAYTVSAWARGRLPSSETSVQLSASETTRKDFALGASHTLSVVIRDVAGKPMPGRVTVLCEGGVCPLTQERLIPFIDVLKDPLVDSIAQVAFAGADGKVDIALPPGSYRVVVSRGPEYSIYPNDWPQNPGVLMDLSNGNANLVANLAKVLDTTGFVSADFHVHGVNSPDSIVDLVQRVTGFAGDGVDVLVSTDHDFVTDYGPTLRQAGLSSHLASVIGEEVSTMAFGHYNIFPLSYFSESLTGGALDWAGPDGPTLRPSQIFEEARRMGARTVHFNHPRGFLGGFTQMRVDTDTLATHATAAQFQMADAPDAVPGNTRLLSSDFNALEVLNNGEDRFQISEVYPKLNDWFTLLSKGMKVAATGTSDTHYSSTVSGWRTWVNTGNENLEAFDALELSTALNQLKATVSNGLFVKAEAFRVDANGTQVSTSAGMGGTVSNAAGDIELKVDIQAPQYLDVTRIEVYMHKPEDDATCPVKADDARASTTRVSCNGQLNRNWPASSITATRNVALTQAQLETVGTFGAQTYKRWRVRETFRLPAPTTDNWVVVLVYGSKSLFPLMFNPASTGSSSTPVLPFALTNPIFVDADGNGFDKPPFNPSAAGGNGPESPEKLMAPRDLDEVLERYHHRLFEH